MEFIRKHKKASITILVTLILLLGISTIFGRYLYNYVNNYILETKEFYFNSSVLTINNKSYLINNWDGVNQYQVTIDLNNRKNSLKKTKADIVYRTEVICGADLRCSVNKVSGTIYQDIENDSYVVTITPLRRFEAGEETSVEIKAIATDPYTKELSATYILKVTENDFIYNIEDETNSSVFTVNFINSVTFYEVSEAFGTHSVGDIISLEDYNELSQEEKDKTFSAIVTLQFDPNIIELDMTNSSYLHRIVGSETLQAIDGHNYVSSYSFKVSATSSEKIVFYKNDITQNYTYPINNDTSIVTLDAEVAGDD